MSTANETTKLFNSEFRYNLLYKYPLFASLTSKDITTLAELMQEVHYAAGEQIVVEGDFVDSFYFIAKGQAEVIQKTIVDGVIGNIILATLSEEEPIGLDSHGFFSPHGRRTATVVALTEITLLRIDIESFNRFIKFHPDFDEEIKEMSELMLKLNFIKKTSPFVHLSKEETFLISQEIEKISIPTQTIIFNQNDTADCCYLIQSGQIEIFSTKDGAERSLAIIGPSELLGEAALLTGNPRNASARSLSECHLFVIKSDLLLKIIKNSKAFTQSILGFMVKRFRPTRCKDVVVHHAIKDGKPMSMLHNTELHQYYRLTEEGMFVWQQLDGVQTVQDLTIAFFQKYKAFAPEFICNLLYGLAEIGFVSIPSIDNITSEESAPRTFWSKLKAKIKKITRIEFSLTHTDEWLTKIYNKGIFLFYTWPLQLFLLLLSITGFGVFIHSYYRITENPILSRPHFWLFLLLFIFVSSITIILHEAAHAFTAKKLGYKIQRIGIGWFGLGPIAYVDTSELWVADRKTQMLVTIAGVYMDFIVGGCFALLSAIMANSILSSFFWLFSLLLYYNGFRNLSPIKEYDGYFLLTEILNYSRLRKSSIHWLTTTFPGFKNNKNEVLYWLACVIYLLISTSLIFFIFQTLFTVFSVSSVLGLPTFYLSAAVAIFMLSMSILSVWHDIKNYLALLAE